MVRNETSNNPQNAIPTMDDDSVWAASSTDMTGLIPAGVTDDEEIKNYENVYPYFFPTGSMMQDPPVSEIELDNKLRQKQDDPDTF